MEEFTFAERGDRVTWCQDRRAHVRVPARALRACARSFLIIITCSRSNILLPVVPLAIVANRAPWSQGVAFLLSYLALVPAIGLFRYGNEVVSVAVPRYIRPLWDSTIGTFSLDLEVVVIALLTGELNLVKTYIAGKIIAACLLTLGCCFVAGTIRHRERTFHLKTVTTLLSLLFTAVTAHAIAAGLHAALSMADSESIGLVYSRGASFVLLSVYIAFAFGRASIFGDPEESSHADIEVRSPGTVDSPGISVAIVMIAIAVTTGYECSASLLGGLDSAGIGPKFVGFCLLPLLFELSEAPRIIQMAYDDRMSMALEIAVATGVQTALLISPALCLLGWASNQPYAFNFEGFPTVVLVSATWLFGILTSTGRGNWLTGCACYAM